MSSVFNPQNNGRWADGWTMLGPWLDHSNGLARTPRGFLHFPRLLVPRWAPSTRPGTSATLREEPSTKSTCDTTSLGHDYTLSMTGEICGECRSVIPAGSSNCVEVMPLGCYWLVLETNFGRTGHPDVGVVHGVPHSPFTFGTAMFAFIGVTPT